MVFWPWSSLLYKILLWKKSVWPLPRQVALDTNRLFCRNFLPSLFRLITIQRLKIYFLYTFWLVWSESQIKVKRSVKRLKEERLTLVVSPGWRVFLFVLDLTLLTYNIVRWRLLLRMFVSGSISSVSGSD